MRLAASRATGSEEETNRIAVSKRSVSSRIRRITWAATVTSRGWVTLSATSRAGFETMASTMSARCIIPPENCEG
ncbi:hypothetical protein BK022_09500 [Methylorubrum extorquens]|uniref:Uncharacterized protein n=1 Tax=Methylorubrum extorquens TaxID=408 RepID=A0A1S1P6M3_METEX|nr:hypothetical protein BK022_09500 [Methylorubrum extorquens]